MYQDQIKTEVEGKVLRTFLSSVPSKQTGLQTQIIKEIVFYISLVEQDISRKREVDKNDTAKLDAGNNENGEYEVKTI